MTKQELIKMTGSEEQADYAMEILLRNCKKAFVRMAIQAELDEIEREVKAFEQEGILVKCNSSYHVNWGALTRFSETSPALPGTQPKNRRQSQKRSRIAAATPAHSFTGGTAPSAFWQ